MNSSWRLSPRLRASAVAFLQVALLFISCNCFAATQQWDIFHVSLRAANEAKPFTDVTLSARFTSDETSIDARGFYDGDGVYRVRFMPPHRLIEGAGPIGQSAGQHFE